MPEQETAGRQPEWALMYALHDALRRDLDALPAARASPAAVRTRTASDPGTCALAHSSSNSVTPTNPVEPGQAVARARPGRNSVGISVRAAKARTHQNVTPKAAVIPAAVCGWEDS
jgi:hypothetical protein